MIDHNGLQGTEHRWRELASALAEARPCITGAMCGTPRLPGTEVQQGRRGGGVRGAAPGHQGQTMPLPVKPPPPLLAAQRGAGFALGSACFSKENCVSSTLAAQRALRIEDTESCETHRIEQ